jgi:IS5 family transposase
VLFQNKTCYNLRGKSNANPHFLADFDMKPHKIDHSQGRLFEKRFSLKLDPAHPLIKMKDLIDWKAIEDHIDQEFDEGRGAPPKPVRLVVGMLMLQHMFDCSDEWVVRFWMENPYWQSFCGFDFFETEQPLNPSSLPKWRKRINEEGFKKILQITIDAGLKAGLLKKKASKKRSQTQQ